MPGAPAWAPGWLLWARSRWITVVSVTPLLWTQQGSRHFSQGPGRGRGRGRERVQGPVTSHLSDRLGFFKQRPEV